MGLEGDVRRQLGGAGIIASRQLSPHHVGGVEDEDSIRSLPSII